MMQFDRSIASLGLGITYFVQVALAYLTTLSICAFIRNARLRVRIWGGFLVWAIAAWVLLWIPAQEIRPVHAVFRSVPLPPNGSTAYSHASGGAVGVVLRQSRSRRRPSFISAFY